MPMISTKYLTANHLTQRGPQHVARENHRLYMSTLCRVYMREICIYWLTWTLENTEDVIINGQPRDNGNTCHIRRRKTKHKTKCVGHHNAQANTNKVNKTLALIQITGDKDVQSIVCMRQSSHTSQHRYQNVKTHNRKPQ